MTEPVRIPVDAVRAHAVNVDRLAEAVETSRAAAAQTHIDRSAYGLMCQFMPEYFEPGMHDIVDGLAGSVTELHALAARLRIAADASERSDASATNRVRNAYSPMHLPL